jgi:extracellular factor (EF) 3-hydroxypalmitic acid methyl ester biosynthesis protein
MDNQELREAPGAWVECAVACGPGDDQRVVGRIARIAARTAHLVADIDLPPDGIIDLLVEVPGRTEPVRIPGDVVASDGGAMKVSFTSVPDEIARQLEHLFRGGHTARPRTGRRLRSSRYSPNELALGELAAEFLHVDEEPRTGSVLNFSGEGLALAVDGQRDMFLAGDLLSHLRVYRGDHVFYDGAAVVRHIHEVEGRTVLGISFQGSMFDLAKLHEVDLREAVQQRVDAFAASARQLDRIDGRFKAWVADAGYYLSGLRETLGREEAQIADEDRYTREAASREILEYVVPRLSAHMQPAFAELRRLVADCDAEAHQRYRQYFQRQLLPAFIDESPFFRRCYRKPLGYAGDYEMMNMVYEDHFAGDTLFGKAINAFGCRIRAAQAVINRIPFLAQNVATAIAGRGDPRIASVACGPAREISWLLEHSPEIEGAQITLMDIEPQAIRFCQRTLLSQLKRSGRNVQIRFVKESVRTLIRDRNIEEVLAPQDVIVSVGLFDYFNDRLFRVLLGRFYELLRPGGHLIVGNFNRDNEDRVLMEYAMEWFLYHRSREELAALAADLPAGARVTVEAEPLDVNLFLHIERPAT